MDRTSENDRSSKCSKSAPPSATTNTCTVKGEEMRQVQVGNVGAGKQQAHTQVRCDRGRCAVGRRQPRSLCRALGDQPATPPRVHRHCCPQMQHNLPIHRNAPPTPQGATPRCNAPHTAGPPQRCPLPRSLSRAPRPSGATRGAATRRTPPGTRPHQRSLQSPRSRWQAARLQSSARGGGGKAAGWRAWAGCREPG